MLRLLSLLQSHRYWPGGELADRLEVSDRTLRRDVERLRELGYPVDASRGVAGGYQLRSGTAMPPLLLDDDDEAVAIAVGVRTAAGGTVEGIEETSVRALAKIVQVMPPRLRRRVDALGTYTVSALADGPRVEAEILTVIAQACRDDERLRFTYTPAPAPAPASEPSPPAPASPTPAAPAPMPSASEASTRLVEPYRLVSLKRRWYLVAWDVERADWRTFRVDRLSSPTVTDARFRPRELPGGDAAAFVSDRLNSRPARHEIVVHVHAPLAEIDKVLVVTGGRVEAIDGASCRLSLSVDAFDWPILILAALRADFDVVEPPEFRDYVRSIGQLFLRATDAL